MSLVIISMMTIVVLNVVFADKEGCPCNKGCVPNPPENIKESAVDSENTEGNVQPLGECMRTWIEKDCGPWYNDHLDHISLFIVYDWPYKYEYYRYYYAHERDCEKWRVWYDNCQHKELYREYLGTEHETQIYLKYTITCLYQEVSPGRYMRLYCY